MTVNFNGTGITIITAKRPGHGDYQVIIDDGNSASDSGFNVIDRFQIPLFEVHNLFQGPHNVTVVSQDEDQVFEIDYVS
jgi:hypothetical protein